MPIELKMPALSPTMEEGTLAKWLVKEGDTVASGDILAEIETDKATMEFEAVDEGKVAKILVPEGTDGVKVGTPIALIAGEGEEVSAASAKSPSPLVGEGGAAKAAQGEGSKQKTPAPSPAPPAKGGGETPAAPSQTAAPHPAPAAPESPAAGSGAPSRREGQERIKASPLARRLAEAQGIDLASLKGSGPGGRIVRADLGEAAGGAMVAPKPVAAPAPAPVEPGDIPHEAIKLSNMRKTIARRLTEAKQTIPHYYLTVDIQLDALVKLRSEINKSLENRGIKLSVNDLLIKALAMALIEVPEANVSFAGDQILKYGRADISVAVAIPDGLITPIIVGANEKSLSKISAEMTDLAGRAKEGKLAPNEYQGGTASISNLGMFGTKQFDAVINPPQGMIMAVGAGEKRPYVVNDTLQIATVMSATGSFDHRAIDGADGARLMKAFKELCEKPLGLVA
jgi:pyruvate dehydrogenase E2 component (dihydrolipoamide acetyltransferase)